MTLPRFPSPLWKPCTLRSSDGASHPRFCLFGKSAFYVRVSSERSRVSTIFSPIILTKQVDATGPSWPVSSLTDSRSRSRSDRLIVSPPRLGRRDVWCSTSYNVRNLFGGGFCWLHLPRLTPTRRLPPLLCPYVSIASTYSDLFFGST